MVESIIHLEKERGGSKINAQKERFSIHVRYLVSDIWVFDVNAKSIFYAMTQITEINQYKGEQKHKISLLKDFKLM